MTPLNEDQERKRLEGLQLLARIIARHVRAHPDRYGAAERRAQRAPVSEGQGREDGAA